MTVAFYNRCIKSHYNEGVLYFFEKRLQAYFLEARYVVTNMQIRGCSTGNHLYGDRRLSKVFQTKVY